MEAKRAAEYEHEKQSRAQATEEMAGWKQQREIRITTKKETNRIEEKVKVETTESEVTNLKVWDRVSKLINSEEIDTKGSDTTRMRKLFIQLKNEPLELSRAATSC